MKRKRFTEEQIIGVLRAERRKEEAVRAKQQERRQRAVAKAEAALEKPNESMMQGQWQSKPNGTHWRRSRAESNRWEKHKEKLQGAARRALNLP